MNAEKRILLFDLCSSAKREYSSYRDNVEIDDETEPVLGHLYQVSSLYRDIVNELQLSDEYELYQVLSSEKEC